MKDMPKEIYAMHEQLDEEKEPYLLASDVLKKLELDTEKVTVVGKYVLQETLRVSLIIKIENG